MTDSPTCEICGWQGRGTRSSSCSPCRLWLNTLALHARHPGKINYVTFALAQAPAYFTRRLAERTGH